MFLFLDDIVEIVSNYAKRQFKELEKYLFQCNQQEIQVLVIALARVYVQDPNDKQITKGGRLGVKELRKCITLCFLRLNHLTSGNLSLLESLQHLLVAKVQSIGSIASFINEELHDQLIDCTLKSICANENEKELKLKESFRYLDEGWCNWGSYLQDINAYSAKYNEIETIDEDAEILFCTIKYSSAKLTEERIKQYLSLLEMPRRTVVYSTIASLLWTMIKITELDERLALMQMWNTSENVNILLLASAVHLFPPTSTVYQTNVTLVLNNALALLRSESNLTDDIRILERTISITNALEAISIIAKHCSSEELETVQALLVSMLYRKSESSFTAVLRTYSYVSSTLGKEGKLNLGLFYQRILF